MRRQILKIRKYKSNILSLFLLLVQYIGEVRSFNLGGYTLLYTGQIQFRHSKEHIFANISDRYFLYTHSYNTIFNWNPFIKEFILNGEYRSIRQWIKIFFERNVAKYIISSTNWLIVRHRTILVSLFFFNFSNQTKFPSKL